MSVQRFGRYELLTELGRGGMAELHLARLSGIGGFEKLFAVKRMLPHLSENKQFSEMFINEGRIVGQIDHVNVCQLFELGEVEGRLFLVMEYLEGETWEQLARALPADPVTRLRAIVGVLAQACDGLHAAHELRDRQGAATPVIHRDISPQNLFVTVAGICKVLDFGVAKMQRDASHTRSGVLKGKIPYMSPEQLRGETVDCRSDVFAMGIVVWEALAGKHLFVRDTDFQMWKALLEEPIAAPSGDARIDGVVMRALERDPANRYASIAAFGEALRGIAEPLAAKELGVLVRAECSERLLARQVELAAIDRPAPIVVDNAWREEPTAHEAPVLASVMLRPDALPVRQRSRVMRYALLGAAAVIAVIVAVLAIGRETQPGPDDAATAVPAPTANGSGERAPPSTEVTDHTPTRVPVVAEPAKRPPPKRAARTAPRADKVETSTAPGLLSVGAEPTARLYLDGRYIEETPTYRHKVAAGRHELRLVPATGKAYQRTIQIEAGKELNLGTVRW